MEDAAKWAAIQRDGASMTPALAALAEAPPGGREGGRGAVGLRLGQEGEGGALRAEGWAERTGETRDGGRRGRRQGSLDGKEGTERAGTCVVNNLGRNSGISLEFEANPAVAPTLLAAAPPPPPPLLHWAWRLGTLMNVAAALKGPFSKLTPAEQQQHKEQGSVRGGITPGKGYE